MSTLTVASVVARIKRFTSRYPSQAQAADALGVSSQYLNDVITGTRRPGPKILRALKLRRVFRYEESGANHS